MTIGSFIRALNKSMAGCAYFMFLSSQFMYLNSQDNRFDITHFGAVSDTNVLSTKFVQHAIDSCYIKGGGTVYVPPGQFLLGTIVLKGNVTLYLEEGATLYASKNIEDYRSPLEDASKPTMIYANGAANLSIKGKGVMNGRAQHTYESLRKVDPFISELTENARAAGVEMKQYYTTKPFVSLVTITDCSNLSFEDFTIKNSPFWSLHIMKSDGILIDRLQISSSLAKGVNADGIDINSCKNVIVTNCSVFTGDDAIVIKGSFPRGSENVSVSNCVVSSSSTALKIGTESTGGFRNIFFTNCKILNANRGLSIVIREGGTAENINFSNINITCKRRHYNWWGNGDPIWVFVTKKFVDSALGYVKRVKFENIYAIGMGTSRIECEEPGHINDVIFESVDIRIEPEDYQDKRCNHGFYANNVSALSLINLSIRWNEHQTEPKWESAIFCERVTNLTILNFLGCQGILNSDAPVVQLVDVSKASIANCNPYALVSNFIRISGTASSFIQMEKICSNNLCNSIFTIDKNVKQMETILLR